MSSDVTLVVSTTDPTPPYEQLRRQLVDLVISGVLGPGERLPPVRQLAADLGLAVGTVARAYRELDAAGVVVTRRGAGTRVSVEAPRRSEAQQLQALREQAQLFVRQARLLGASQDEIRAAYEDAAATTYPPQPQRTLSNPLEQTYTPCLPSGSCSDHDGSPSRQRSPC